MIGRPRAHLKTLKADICIIIDQLRAPGKCRKSGALCLIFRYIFLQKWNILSGHGAAARPCRPSGNDTVFFILPPAVCAALKEERQGAPALNPVRDNT